MDFKDYYAVLDVPHDASADDIRKAYRKMVRKYHPDVSKEPDAEARMREVNEANDVLGDPEKRAAYDALAERVKNGGTADAQGGFQPPPGWDEGFAFRRAGAGGAAEEADFSDFFSSLFGSARRGGGMRGAENFSVPGEDQHAAIEIPLADAISGVTRDVTLRALERDAQGHPSWKEKTLRVKIPAGVHPGQFIRLAGQGLPGTGGASAGDLYLEVRIAPDDRYRVEGRDIYLTLPVTPTEAALGARVPVPTPTGGRVEVNIPVGSRAGMKLRLKGHGLPGKPAGDYYLLLDIVLPPATSEAAKAAYRALAEAAPLNPRSALGV